jgi:chromosome segregation ATPase
MSNSDKEFEEWSRTYSNSISNEEWDGAKACWDFLYPYKERCETLEAKVKELETVIEIKDVTINNWIDGFEEVKQQLEKKTDALDEAVKVINNIRSDSDSLSSRIFELELKITANKTKYALEMAYSKSLEALLIEACELINIGDENHLSDHNIYSHFLNKPEIKKLLEGVKSE